MSSKCLWYEVVLKGHPSQGAGNAVCLCLRCNMCEPYGDICISHYSHWLHMSPAGPSTSSTVAFPYKMYEWLTTFTQQTGAWFIHCWATCTHSHIMMFSFRARVRLDWWIYLFNPKTQTQCGWRTKRVVGRKRSTLHNISCWCRPCFSHLSLVQYELIKLIFLWIFEGTGAQRMLNAWKLSLCSIQVEKQQLIWVITPQKDVGMTDGAILSIQTNTVREQQQYIDFLNTAFKAQPPATKYKLTTVTGIKIHI